MLTTGDDDIDLIEAFGDLIIERHGLLTGCSTVVRDRHRKIQAYLNVDEYDILDVPLAPYKVQLVSSRPLHPRFPSNPASIHPPDHQLRLCLIESHNIAYPASSYCILEYTLSKGQSRILWPTE